MSTITGTQSDVFTIDDLKKERLIGDISIYNLDGLKKKHDIEAKNGSDFLLKLIEKKGAKNLAKILKDINGVYAFAYYEKGRTYLARDIIGLVPMFICTDPHFAFATRKKALHLYSGVSELDPREILCYDTKTGSVGSVKRDFFRTKPAADKNVIENLEKLLINAVKIRLPGEKFGLLFSGGVDSSLLALVLKKLGADFTCYTAALDESAGDLAGSKKSAELLGLDLRQKVIGFGALDAYLQEVAPLVEDPDVVKLGVALPIHVACEMAREDGCGVIFSGLGPDELFAGYKRHKTASDVNEACLRDMLQLYERNTYRDFVVTRAGGLELRTPYLDTNLVSYALRLPARHKTDGKRDKIILRRLAERMGVDKKIAHRKKHAAQYGSRFDWGLDRLARTGGITKSEYLKLASGTKYRLGVLYSSGKDSTAAMHIARERGHTISCLITLASKNPDSYMFHTQNIDMTALQAEALGIPRIEQQTAGVKENELKDLEKAIARAKSEYSIEGVVTGALFSTYQKDRIERVCRKHNLLVVSPLWNKNQLHHMREAIKTLDFVFTSVAAEGLDASWLGRIITEKDINRLIVLYKKYGINIAGEGGEFESLVLDAPMFKKRVKIEDFSIQEESQNTAKMVITKASLVGK